MQRCIDALAGSDTALAILPAGTANLLATNLDIPQDIEQAVAIGLRGERRQTRRRLLQRRALRRHGRRGIRRIDDSAGGRDAQGPAGPRRLHLDRLAEPARQAVQGEDQGRRRPLVRGRRELHPRRQRRPALRRHRGLRGRTSRRRPLRDRRRQRRRDRRLGTHPRSHGGGAGRAVAARPGDVLRRRSRSSSAARCSTSSTAATGARSSRSRSACSPARSPSAYPRRSRATMASTRN